MSTKLKMAMTERLMHEISIYRRCIMQELADKKFIINQLIILMNKII